MSDFLVLNTITGRVQLVAEQGYILAELTGVTKDNANARLRKATGRTLTTLGVWRASRDGVAGRVSHAVAKEK
jgi:hypothetical protein